jgi:hypothetical protein
MYEFPSGDTQELVVDGNEEHEEIEGCVADMLSIEAQLQPPPSQLQGNDTGLSNCWLTSLSGVMLSR